MDTRARVSEGIYSRAEGAKTESSLQNLIFNPWCQLVTLETSTAERSPLHETCREHHVIRYNPTPN